MSGPLNLVPGRQARLQYGSAVRRGLKLLEVDESVLKELQTRGGCIKGGSPADEAVLCTETHTYALKHVGTTNTQLLMPPAQNGAVDVGVAAETDYHMEAVLAAPRLADLDSLLPLFDGEEDGGAALSGGGSPREASTNGAAAGPLTFDELLTHVQASKGELRAALQERRAVELDGTWRRLEPGFLGTLLEVLLLSATQHGWAREAIDGDAAAAALQQDGFDPRVVRHCLSLFCSPADGGGDSDSGTPRRWRLDDRKVARHFAVRLLRQQSTWERHEFMSAWQDALPEGIEPDESVLRGEALAESEDRVRSFPAGALPTQPAARFAALFAARRRWAAADILPYLQGVQAPGHSVEALLLRYARASQPSPAEPPVYSAR